MSGAPEDSLRALRELDAAGGLAPRAASGEQPRLRDALGLPRAEPVLTGPRPAFAEAAVLR